ncbi:hypothetical protein LZ31DRAFT_592313 [Colletotrichum somersetense]|nr:hypothetical protein LZ31DRAFT_592313 [Colletotrichum somersetense]
MDSVSNTSIVNGDISSRATDPNEAQRLQDQRLRSFFEDEESLNPLPRKTTSVEQHKKNMSKKINKIMFKAKK